MTAVSGRPAAAVELAVEELTVENARGGAAAEVGAELYIRCRVAAHGAKFGVPIARTVGNTLSIANLARVHAAFGLQRARRMLLLAQTIDDAEALACGYLHATAAPAALQAQADELVAALAALAPVTQSAVKEGLRRIVQHGLPEADDLIRRCYGSADFREAVSAFVDKRKPAWTGR